MPELLGRTEPRLATEPLRKLTKRTSAGFEAALFAEQVVGIELLPWQRWWLEHALELDQNGDYRFNKIVTLVSRQSGKTTLLKLVTLWSMFTGRAKLVLGTAQSLDIAREVWQGVVDIVEGDPELSGEIETVRRVNGQQEFRLANGTRYRIAASTRSAGRGLSVDLLILDEVREQRDWAAWSALSATTLARPCSLTVCISNAGDSESVVLNGLREAALAGTDRSIGLFEWSAEPDCALDDRQAWAQAIPGLGRTISVEAVRSALAVDTPAVFRAELLCQRVDQLEGAFSLPAWKDGADPSGSLEPLRDRLAVVLDAAPDGQHVALLAAGQMPDGRYRLEVLAAWKSIEAARTEFAEVLGQVKPVAFGWFPTGPAAALGAEIRKLKVRGMAVTELTGSEVTELCQEFAALVEGRRIVHSGDPLLDAHIAGCKWYQVGDGKRYVRRGAGHVDAAYAAAGATHLLRGLPPAASKRRLVI